eukprot:CAMPEP_0177755780 /NCGR_PEP_ID=MMETSP0491_2-20121128/2753_1 /TAXON_ID=63592 /ORGANISM="Tetraselmis chuii, Strain PLY429" /LENGTH=375 /DNA_ID=CAMNT_0019271309 /DNA_START=213 /DNA_END=1340 /DNA_ORIENTATION=-
MGTRSTCHYPLRASHAGFRASFRCNGLYARRPMLVVSAASAPGKRSAVPVEFHLPLKVPNGKAAFLVGSCEELGSWSPDDAKQMKRTAGDVWQSTVELPVGEEVEYKYVIVEVKGGSKGRWQKGDNLRVCAEDGGAQVVVTDSWMTNGGEHEVMAEPLNEVDTTTTVLAARDDEGASSTAETMVNVDFRIKREVAFGRKMYLVGSAPALGTWTLLGACKMNWSEGHVWNASIQVPPGGKVEYKYAIMKSSGYEKGESVKWQEGPNNVLNVASDADWMAVQDAWEAGDVSVEHRVVEAMAPPPTKPAAVERETAVETAPMLEMEEIEIVTPSGQILSDMTVRELKDQLRDLGLCPTGRKVVLVGRLSEFLAHISPS